MPIAVFHKVIWAHIKSMIKHYNVLKCWNLLLFNQNTETVMWFWGEQIFRRHRSCAFGKNEFPFQWLNVKCAAVVLQELLLRSYSMSIPSHSLRVFIFKASSLRIYCKRKTLFVSACTQLICSESAAFLDSDKLLIKCDWCTMHMCVL